MSSLAVAGSSLEPSVLAATAIGETVTLLHPTLPLAGVSIETMRECQQNDRTLADGYLCRGARVAWLGPELQHGRQARRDRLTPLEKTRDLIRSSQQKLESFTESKDSW